MSLPASEFVAMAAAEAFQMSKCECKLVDLLALALLWDEAVMLLKDCRIFPFASEKCSASIEL